MVEAMTLHVSTVTASQQRVHSPAAFLFFSCVVAGCLFVWRFIPALQVSNSVLAGLALHAFLVVSKPMLQSESIYCCCKCMFYVSSNAVLGW